MRSGSKTVRLCLLLTAFLALSAMAGCPKSSDVQGSNARPEGPPDHDNTGMGHAAGGMGGGMGM